VFPPVVDVLIRQAALLHAYMRSAHTGSVVLLAAALLLPFAQGGQLLASVARSARASADRPHPVFERARESDRPTIQSPKTHVSAAAALGLPARLGSPEAGPEPVSGALVPERTSPVLERRDLERGPPFFL
jgi:hypothetical protein